jgi:hypothetical protein
VSAVTEWDVLWNSICAVAGMRTDLDLIRLGLRGLEIPPSATIQDCHNQICDDFNSGELAKRLANQQPPSPTR